jgi:hypothetical protein
MVNVGIFYAHLGNFMAILYNVWPVGIPSLGSFDIFFPIWNVWTKTNLATLFLCIFIRKTVQYLSGKFFSEKASSIIHRY